MAQPTRAVGEDIAPRKRSQGSRSTGGYLRAAYARMLASADILIDGPRPWDMSIHDERLFWRCLCEGTIGLGEAYVEGWWDAAALDQFFEHVSAGRIDDRMVNVQRRLGAVLANLVNLQNLTRARRVAEIHYDLSNDLYRAMLGERMVYTCGYWREADTLDAAQEAKLDLVCRKLELAPGMRVLDVGCGWGSFARFAAEHYGAEVIGVTISRQQATLARAVCDGLPVEIRLQDYREVHERFDRIASLGMFEHVGHKNYRVYMETMRRNLKDDGLFLLHTIGHNNRHLGVDPWVAKYIFPNSEIPSLQDVAQAIDRVLVLEDLQNFGADYARTLMAWFGNFDAAWPRLEPDLPTRFYRLWKYYLQMCAGIFRARGLQLWQLVLSPKGVAQGYRRPLL